MEYSLRTNGADRRGTVHIRWKTSIDGFAFTQPRVAALESQIEDYMMALVDEQVRFAIDYTV
jgi:hypothetical protein